MSSRFSNYGELSKETIKNVTIEEKNKFMKTEDEKKNVEPDKDKLAKLTYQQLMVGMGLFANNGRFSQLY